MSFHIQPVDYFYTKVNDEPGEGYKVLAQLAEAGGRYVWNHGPGEKLGLPGAAVVDERPRRSGPTEVDDRLAPGVEEVG